MSRPKGTRALLYTRISRDDTGDGAGVRRQEESCRQFAATRGWEVVGVESDRSISAFTGRTRPGFERVIAMAESGQVDYIVAYAVDRITRSLADWVRIDALSNKHGVALVTAIGDADLSDQHGRTLAGLMAFMARQESERKAERQRAANTQRAASNRPWTSGTRTFGYTQDKTRIVPAEAAAIRNGADQALSGVFLLTITRQWTTAGLLSGRAEPKGWAATAVRYVLTNPTYIRQRIYHGQQYLDGNWPAILDETTHHALVAKFASPSRGPGTAPRGRQPSTLLSGIATCHTCGSLLRASRDSRNGHTRYRCASKRGCVWVPRDDVDSHVEEQMLALLAQPYATEHETAPHDNITLRQLYEEAAALHARRETVDNGYADGQIELPTHRRLIGLLDARLRIVKASVLETHANRLSLAFRGLRSHSDIRAHWVRLPLEARRTLISARLTISITNAKRGRGPYDVHDKVRIQRQTL